MLVGTLGVVIANRVISGDVGWLTLEADGVDHAGLAALRAPSWRPCWRRRKPAGFPNSSNGGGWLLASSSRSFCGGGDAGPSSEGVLAGSVGSLGGTRGSSAPGSPGTRTAEHTSELQALMRHSYAAFLF